MTNSVGSILNDDTPTDSGVQLLDSEADLLNDSMISSIGFDFETCSNDTGKITTNEVVNSENIPDLPIPLSNLKNVPSKNDIENNNEGEMPLNPDVTSSMCDSGMMSSMHSTFDSENTEIVYRRKIKKQTKSAPKKRVSFHEDILKNTKTDNIHIEHGFITYKGKNSKPSARYSWCSAEYNNAELDVYDDKENECQYVYRNACSEVLDYGKTDILDEEDKETAKADKSGVFEYPHLGANRFYKCNCSSSSSIDSGSSGENNSNASSTSDTKTNEACSYKQSKSSSCDCIGTSSNIEIGKGTCFFSEPSIERSVWSKEKKPKGSCLKKSKIADVVISENKIDSNVKKFNIHQISSSVIKDNGKMIIGSLKDIFGISLPERGVPEGSEDLHAVTECIPQESNEKDLSFLHKVGLFKPNPSKIQKLSKSLDGGLGNQTKKFVHNVDEQLRRANEEDLYAPSTSNSRKNSLRTESSVEEKEADEDMTSLTTNSRNKFIINCESTVYEHTGIVEICEQTSLSNTPIAPAIDRNPFKKRLNSILNSFANNAPRPDIEGSSNESESSEIRAACEGEEDNSEVYKKLMETSILSTSSDKNSSVMSDVSSNETTSTNHNYDIRMNNAGAITKKSKHLSSPLRNKRERINQTRMSPDLFNRDFLGSGSIASRNTSSLLSEDFDDILTITTENTGKTNDDSNDIVIVDYSDVKNEMECSTASVNSYYLKLPSIMTSSTTSTASKTSLINRFLRNVTQKKILEASFKRNNFFQAKLKNETKLFGGNLFVKGVKATDDSLIKALNDEIDMEIEMGCNSLDYEEEVFTKYATTANEIEVKTTFEKGIGELKTEHLDIGSLKLFRDQSETLMKAFKLYTGYSNEGHMTPVLVLLTDKTLYVIDMVRNKLCNKFVLPYSELDVILMGPMGNTVLLSNNARDMQQVLLTCGPYPAERLISSLEMCARRGGSNLPAVGQLTLDHFAPLQAFVCHNSSVSKTDTWKYYAVCQYPAGIMGVDDDDPLGPNLQGFFMHRNLSHAGVVQRWSAGYFMLKAGVLYLFQDSTQRIPSWAVSLPTECKGARRCLTTNRPHCFEILLRTGSLQLAAPDEYVASDWLQSVIQAASGNFEMDDTKKKTLGCTIVMTENHLLTLREDFSSPLKRVMPQQLAMMSPSLGASKENIDPSLMRKMSNSTILDTSSEVSSIRSTPSTPSRGCRSITTMCNTPTRQNRKPPLSPYNNIDDGQSHTNMTSLYGKNSGIEVLTCAAIEELTSIKIPNNENSWWCLLVSIFRIILFTITTIKKKLLNFHDRNLHVKKFVRTLMI